MYRYQMHTHTSPCSHCGRMTPEELCRGLFDGGYAGAVLTNHFLGGNTGIDRTLPWDEFVAAYTEDYLACREAARQYDLDILFGLEEGVGGGVELLLYGLTPEILCEHRELRHLKACEWVRTMRECGVLVVQAHPYRARPYITTPGPLPLPLLDGIEIYNLGNHEEENEMAKAFAAEHPELLPTSGADTHYIKTVASGGIVCPHRIRTEAELAAVLRARDYELIPL